MGISRNKNVFRNIFRLFCSWEQNSQNGIQVFWNENSSQTNAYLHYSNYSYSGLIPNERALNISIRLSPLHLIPLRAKELRAWVPYCRYQTWSSLLSFPFTLHFQSHALCFSLPFLSVTRYRATMAKEQYLRARILRCCILFLICIYTAILQP